jgi:hypothetical protein
MASIEVSQQDPADNEKGSSSALSVANLAPDEMSNGGNPTI